MTIALIGLVLLLIMILVALRFGMNRNIKPEEQIVEPLINTSGIYSIVRKNPRESVKTWKPHINEIQKFLATTNEIIETDKARLMAEWEKNLEENLREIENGDREGVEFYYYYFLGDDPVCHSKVSKGHFVTRQEIFDYPKIIPPFHIGCKAMLKRHHGSENLHETTQLGMRPLFVGGKLPDLPKWKDVLYKS